MRFVRVGVEQRERLDFVRVGTGLAPNHQNHVIGRGQFRKNTLAVDGAKHRIVRFQVVLDPLEKERFGVWIGFVNGDRLHPIARLAGSRLFDTKGVAVDDARQIDILGAGDRIGTHLAGKLALRKGNAMERQNALDAGRDAIIAIFLHEWLDGDRGSRRS